MKRCVFKPYYDTVDFARAVVENKRKYLRRWWYLDWETINRPTIKVWSWPPPVWPLDLTVRPRRAWAHHPRSNSFWTVAASVWQVIASQGPYLRFWSIYWILVTSACLGQTVSVLGPSLNVLYLFKTLAWFRRQSWYLDHHKMCSIYLILLTSAWLRQLVSILEISQNFQYLF